MDDLSNKLGSELGTIIVNQAATISKLKILLDQEQSKNTELNIQLKALPNLPQYAHIKTSLLSIQNNCMNVRQEATL